jgi:hypothetical protein
VPQSFEIPVTRWSRDPPSNTAWTSSYLQSECTRARDRCWFHLQRLSGIIANGLAGVFANTPNGNQAAFLQGYQGGGSQIDWLISGLTVGTKYELSFAAAGSLVVPAETFGVSVSVFGSAATLFTPGGAFTNNSLLFTASASGGTISFIGSAIPGNSVSALDNLVISTVPEPTTLAPFGAGLVGIGALRRRRKAKNQSRQFGGVAGRQRAAVLG